MKFIQILKNLMKHSPQQQPQPPVFQQPLPMFPQQQPQPSRFPKLTPSMFMPPTTITKFLPIKVPANPAETPVAQRVQGFYIVPEPIHDSDFRRQWELDDEWEKQLDYLAEVEHVVGSNEHDGRMTTMKDLKNIWGDRSFIEEKYARTPAP